MPRRGDVGSARRDRCEEVSLGVVEPADGHRPARREELFYPLRHRLDPPSENPLGRILIPSGHLKARQPQPGVRIVRRRLGRAEKKLAGLFAPARAPAQPPQPKEHIGIGFFHVDNAQRPLGRPLEIPSPHLGFDARPHRSSQPGRSDGCLEEAGLGEPASLGERFDEVARQRGIVRAEGPGLLHLIDRGRKVVADKRDLAGKDTNRLPGGSVVGGFDESLRGTPQQFGFLGRQPKRGRRCDHGAAFAGAGLGHERGRTSHPAPGRVWPIELRNLCGRGGGLCDNSGLLRRGRGSLSGGRSLSRGRPGPIETRFSGCQQG